jgi:cell filamentation protein
MKNNYRYIDPDYTYTDPQTGVLRNKLIEEYRIINNNEKEQVARKLAFVLDSVNELHPFREGNGRAQREFIRTLALEKGYSLNLNPPDNIDVYECYMSGTIYGDVEKLAKLIGELLI